MKSPLSNFLKSLRGFSLVESVVALPVALVLLVVVGQSVPAGRAAEIRCQDNLRNLMAAVYRFADDKEGRMPDAVDNKPRVWKWWMNDLFPYVENIRDFYCPVKAPDLYTTSGTSPLLPVIWDYNLSSYGMNYRLGSAHDRDPELKLSEIRSPENTIIFCESNHYLIRTSASLWGEDIAPRHGGKTNVAFLDGHVESFAVTDSGYPTPNGKGLYDLKKWQIERN